VKWASLGTSRKIRIRRPQAWRRQPKAQIAEQLQDSWVHFLSEKGIVLASLRLVRKGGVFEKRNDQETIEKQSLFVRNQIHQIEDERNSLKEMGRVSALKAKGSARGTEERIT